MTTSGAAEGSLVQRAMQAVTKHIHAHALRVGDTLPGEKHFATTLGVSRAVMREAFGALAALKLIDVGNGRKPKVAALDESVIATSMNHAISTAQITVPEVWDVRRTIELRTAQLAATWRTDAEAERIVGLAEAIAAHAGDLEAITGHDIAFHEAVAQASHNVLFLQIVRAFGPLMQVAVPRAWRTRTTKAQRVEIVRRHRAVARAIRDRDADAAGAAMEAHFDTSIGAILSGVANPATVPDAKR